jgi:glycine/serine hydroxymethyltransferase
MTTQGMKEDQAIETASFIVQALRAHGDDDRLGELERQIRELAASFAPYPADFVGHV